MLHEYFLNRLIGALKLGKKSEGVKLLFCHRIVQQDNKGFSVVYFSLVSADTNIEQYILTAFKSMVIFEFLQIVNQSLLFLFII